MPGNGGPGSVHTNSRSWTAPTDGIAVFAGGHLHEGGIDITLKDTTSNKTFCTGTATYHENPRHLATINPCLLHQKVIAGHNYTRHGPLRQLGTVGRRDGHLPDLRLVGHPVVAF